MKNSFERSNSFNNPDRLFLSWDQYGSLIDDLCNIIKNSGIIFDYVYGIPRGGLIPAVAISNKLNFHLLITKYVQISLEGKTILLCDDMADTGKTLKEFTNDTFFEDIKIITASIFKHKNSKFVPDYYVTENDKWVVFPYEENHI
jgi:uncharacterized protein